MAPKSSLIALAACAAFSVLKTCAGQQNMTQTNATSVNCTMNEKYGPDGTTYNASGSYQVPNFEPPGFNVTSPVNLTYNTAVIVNSSIGYSLHTVWIDTATGVDIGSKDMPYVGCVTAYVDLPQSTIRRGQDDNGDCTKTFDKDCVNAILNHVKGIIGASSHESAGDPCIDYFTSLTVPQACKKYASEDRWSAVSSPAIGNSTNSNGIDDRGCSHQGANRGFFGWENSHSSDGGKGSSNNTKYDRSVTTVTPYLTTVWQREGRGWSDARLTCMRANQIKNGSRTPKDVPSSGVRVTFSELVNGLSLAVALASTSMLW